MNLSRYFWGMYSLAKSWLKIKISQCLGFGQYPDYVNYVKGVAEITSIPPTNIPGNNIHKRELFIGCKIPGKLLSPNKFLARSHACWEAIEATNPDKKEEVVKYINFLKKQVEENDFLLFKKCFIFSKR